MANAARIYVGGLRPDVSERELEDEVCSLFFCHLQQLLCVLLLLCASHTP